MKYTYREAFYMVESVKMEYCDSDGKINSIFMEYDWEDNCWFCQCDREVIRYKFVVNDIIRLNDPIAKEYMHDEKWEVWSVPGERVEILPELDTYVISNNINNGVKNAVKKTQYIYDRPIDIYTGVSVRNVKGLHSLTYMCFQPDGSIYMLEESSIGQFETNEADYEVIFKNRISRIQGRNAEGMWSIQLYMDGKCIVKDYFAIKRNVLSNIVLLDCKI